MASKKPLQVYEHSFLAIGESGFESRHFAALSKLNALNNYQYFDLKHNGIVFKQYVGIIQVDGLKIEILPKIDRYDSNENKFLWQSVLIEMLRTTNRLKIQHLGPAVVSRQSIHLLDLFFKWYLTELRLLIRQGLIKQYYQETSNVNALKGRLIFSGHISRNLVHKERFYTAHQVYDTDHLIHQILSKALAIVAGMSRGTYLYNSCKSILMDFPEVKNTNVNEATFGNLPKSRKIAPYETALSLARLIILNYAPNVSSGTENMLSLLFDMNELWEEYILVRLKHACRNSNIEVYGQDSKRFWLHTSMRPDIVLIKNKGTEREKVLIVDTKWKNIDLSKPSVNDLRQMYVYNEFWNSQRSLLLYPSQKTNLIADSFIKFTDDRHACSIGRVSVLDDKMQLNTKIADPILALID